MDNMPDSLARKQVALVEMAAGVADGNSHSGSDVAILWDRRALRMVQVR